MTDAEKKLITAFDAAYDRWSRSIGPVNYFGIKENAEILIIAAGNNGSSKFKEAVITCIGKLGQAARIEELGLSLSMSNELISMLSESDSLEQMMEEATTQSGLLWVIMDHATTYTYQPNVLLKPHLRNVLTRITKLTLSDELNPTLDIVVAHLYGPAVWELYGQTLNSRMNEGAMCKIMEAVLSLDLPLRGKVDAISTEQTPTLPADMAP